MKLRLVIIFLFMINNFAVASGVQNELHNIFNSMGLDSNYTSGGSFHDQSGGYYTGGRLFARSKVRNTQILNITPPSFSAGCGGIDMFTGGFSFISADALVNTMKSIASNAVSYSFNLALQTAAPQIYNTLAELNALAQEINNTNINSCETAATMVGSMWPKSDTSSRYLCSAMGTSNNKFSDWAQARQECGKAKNRTSGEYYDDSFKDVLGDEFNLAWVALRKNNFLSSNRLLAELFMSISGTIVSKAQDGSDRFQKKHYTSLAKNNEFIQALIEGGQNIKIYKCTDVEKCLDLTTQSLEINASSALRPRIDSLLRSIAYKIKADEAISKEELALVNASTIPIYKVLAVQAAFREGSGPINISNFSEAIAYDLLLKYLEEVLDIAEESLRELGAVQIDDSSISSLKRDIANSRKIMIEKRNGIFQQIHYSVSIMQHTKQIEQQMHNMFSQGANRGGK